VLKNPDFLSLTEQNWQNPPALKEADILGR